MADFMGNSVTYVVALIVTLGVLIAFHEFGHFWVARRLGVKVLRYSIGFGKPLWLRRSPRDGTEYVIAAVPLGGYVRFLDEAEGPVAPEERKQAFNNQSLARRSAIVAAGPLANFLFAVLAFAAVNMIGTLALKPLLGEPEPASIAAAAGFQDGDLIVAVAGRETSTMNDALLDLVEQASAVERIEVRVRDASGESRTRWLDLSGAGDVTRNGELLENLGLTIWQPPDLPAVIDRLVGGGAAETAGLRPGDRIVALDGEPISGWFQWADEVRRRPGETLTLGVLRDGERLEVTLTPNAVDDEGETVGQAGAYLRAPDDYDPGNRLLVQHGPLEAVAAGAEQTWKMTWFTLRMLGRMLVGKVSLENISGPITIAQFAGQSAMVGLTAFLGFMAMVSISLGVINLLPVPVLDGGHLLFYAVEAVKGSPLSDNALYIGQRAGLGAIILLMSIALFNDFSRLLG